MDKGSYSIVRTSRGANRNDEGSEYLAETGSLSAFLYFHHLRGSRARSSMFDSSSETSIKFRKVQHIK